MADRFAPLENRRIGVFDTRPQPHIERRHGAPDTRTPEKLKRATFRVNYFKGGQAAVAFVCAYTDNDASVFMGVRDGSAQVNRVAYPVEIEGVDAAHDALPVMEVFKAPPAPPKQFTDAELVAIRAFLLSPMSKGDRRHGAPDTRPAPQVDRRRVPAV